MPSHKRGDQPQKNYTRRGPKGRRNCNPLPSSICPTCKGPKYRYGRAICRKCWKAIGRSGPDDRTYKVDGTLCRRIALTDGFYALVEAQDFEWLSQWTWYVGVDSRKKYKYATRATGVRNNHRSIMMHCVITATKVPQRCDHKNFITLDNRRSNLRSCTHAQNVAHQRKHAGREFIGVYWHRKSGLWHARVSKGGREFCDGYFKTAKEAAKMRDQLAMKHFGEFAVLNFPQSSLGNRINSSSSTNTSRKDKWITTILNLTHPRSQR